MCVFYFVLVWFGLVCLFVCLAMVRVQSSEVCEKNYHILPPGLLLLKQRNAPKKKKKETLVLGE